MPIATHIIQMIIIIERTQHFNNILFLAAISSSLFHVTHAQRAAQLVAPRAIPDTSNQSLGILLVVLVIAFLVTGFCSFYLRQCSETYVLSGTTTIGPKGLDPEVLATFPIMLYSAVKTGQNVALQCAVCLSEFNDLDKLRLLPKCSHVFHPDCIDAWLASHVTCPVCRAKLKPDCGEIAVEIEHENIARQVFDESSVRRGEVVGGGNEGGGSGNIDGRVGKDNGSSNIRAFGVLVRSHSTGHSLVEPGKNMERFTLRLSEEVRKHILDDKRGGSMTMKRSASYDVVLESEEGCSGKGWWGRSEGGEGSNKGKNKWMLSMTPPFVSRGLNASTTCSGIPRFWTSSIVREDKESEGEGRTIFQVL